MTSLVALLVVLLAAPAWAQEYVPPVHSVTMTWEALTGAPGAPPLVLTPVDCAETAGPWDPWPTQWVRSPATSPLEYQWRERIWTNTAYAANGGAACANTYPFVPIVVEREDRIRGVQTTTITCTVTGVGSKYKDGDQRPVVRCNTNGLLFVPVGTVWTVEVPPS